MASPRSAHERLARLISDQARDDRSRVCWGTHECDMAPRDSPRDRVFEQFPDYRADDPAAVLEAAESVDLVDREALSVYRHRTGAVVGPKLIGLASPWQAAELAYPGGPAPCPAHPDGPPPPGSTCLICSASRLEPKQHPMAGTPTKPTRPVRKVVVRKAKGKGKGKAAPTVFAELAGGLGPVGRPIAV